MKNSMKKTAFKMQRRRRKRRRRKNDIANSWRKREIEKERLFWWLQPNIRRWQITSSLHRFWLRNSKKQFLAEFLSNYVFVENSNKHPVEGWALIQ